MIKTGDNTQSNSSAMVNPNIVTKFDREFTPEIDVYIRLCEEKDMNPTVAGFAQHINTEVAILKTWANKRKIDENGEITEQLARPNFNAALKRLSTIELVNKPTEPESQAPSKPEPVQPEPKKEELPEVKQEEKSEEAAPLLKPQQERFCRLYTQNTEYFGNATLSYAAAYGYELDSLSKIREKTEKGKDIVGTSDYDRTYDMCSANSSRLLRNDKIQDFLRKCYNDLMRNDVVDSELIKVILQERDLTPKVAAIKEYNKLKARVVDNIDVKSDGKPIAQVVAMNYVAPVKPDGTDNSND